MKAIREERAGSEIELTRTVIQRSFSELRAGDEICGVGRIDRVRRFRYHVDVLAGGEWREFDGLVPCFERGADR